MEVLINDSVFNTWVLAAASVALVLILSLFAPRRPLLNFVLAPAIAPLLFLAYLFLFDRSSGSSSNSPVWSILLLYSLFYQSYLVATPISLAILVLRSRSSK